MPRKQTLGFFAAGLIPALWLLIGLILWLPGNSVLTGSYVAAYLLLPVLCLLLLWRTIRSQKGPAAKWLLSILILSATVFLCITLMSAGHFSLYDHAEGEKGLTMYESEIGHYDLMPEITDLAEPEKIEYHYFYNQFATFFDSECFTLICTYAPEDYAVQTEALDTHYTFHTEPLDAGETALPPLYTLDGYQFRFLEMGTDLYNLWFPQYMVLVGTNDETREIVWTYYDDDDLDYITDPEHFLLEDCGWKFIRLHKNRPGDLGSQAGFAVTLCR